MRCCNTFFKKNSVFAFFESKPCVMYSIKLSPRQSKTFFFLSGAFSLSVKLCMSFVYFMFYDDLINSNLFYFFDKLGIDLTFFFFSFLLIMISYKYVYQNMIRVHLLKGYLWYLLIPLFILLINSFSFF